MADAFTAKSFLVVDDFADMRSAIKGILISLGVTRIDQANNGKEAIAKLQNKHFDVILCDYNLGPGKDGQQVLEEARHRRLIGVDTIFIMITAENTREMVMGAVEYAPDSYLSKPFTKELLRTRLTKLFERKADLTKVNEALMAKDTAAAIRELDALIAAKPRNLGELLKLKSELCIDSSRLDEAMATLEQVLAIREMPWARLGIGKIQFQRKQYDQALETFRHLTEQEPNFIAAYDWLAKTQVAKRRFAEAEETLRLAVRLSPRGIQRQHTLGELALNNGHTEIAEGAYEQAVTLAKHSVLNHPALFAGLANSKSANGKYDEALKVTAEINKVFPDRPEASFYAASATALVKTRQGDKAGAEAALAEAEQVLAQLNETVHASEHALEMAKTYAGLGRADKATALLRQVIANNHDDDETLNRVVQLCQESGLDYDAETAIQEVQRDVVKTNNEGVRLIKQGEFEAAIQLLTQAANEMPGNKTINLNAAKAILMYMERRGVTEEGLRTVRCYIDRVQSLAPDDWRLADVNARLRKLTTTKG
ncbi:tetratricopeptide repeat-containing response regulator [Thermochromatium tepidum]|jgi:Response regulator containing a CheY-like receiver domain and an HD-GYP domain|uniref:Response regulator n=1 Tax=Thermochromatium tepidum ATCC 43061 TaxID=316276 RepID=A0A6I6DWL6_THETI|nr:tetratricopeptide repeat-containing response regulator [Thermochromatium tepidum]QGU31901.1 response regulator [Thermochromatium tepidum ATCC 43061]